MQPAGDVLYLYPPGSGRYRPWSLQFARGISRHVAWADVVHVSNLYLPHTLYAYVACRRWRKPYVVQPHGTLERYQRSSRRWSKRVYDLLFGARYLRAAAGYHFTSETERGVGGEVIDTERAFVVPIPVDLGSEWAGSSAQRVIFLGRVTAKKRLDVLLDAWPQVRRRHPEAELVIAGPVDPDQRRLMEQALSMAGVEYAGVVEGSMRAKLFESAAIFALPSENENFAIAAAEAMAAGVPILVSGDVALGAEAQRAGGGEVLTDLVPVHWAEALCSWLGNPARLQAAGKAAWVHAELTWSAAAIGSELMDHLRARVEVSKAGSGQELAQERGHRS
jgi:glycosyltransferase involved in cell wall biosynthesis